MLLARPRLYSFPFLSKVLVQVLSGFLAGRYPPRHCPHQLIGEETLDDCGWTSTRSSPDIMVEANLIITS